MGFKQYLTDHIAYLEKHLKSLDRKGEAYAFSAMRMDELEAVLEKYRQFKES